MSYDVQMIGWFLENERYDEAWDVTEQALRRDPHNFDALFMLGQIELRQGHKGAAFQYFMRSEAEVARQGFPPKPETYNNIGCCLHDEQHMEDAKAYFLRSLELDPESTHTLANLCAVESALGDPQKAIAWGEEVLKKDPNNADALYNSALSMFMVGRWSEAWDRYKYSIGNEYRTLRNYHEGMETPRWNGTDGNVVIYGEQGLGDEILFASMIPDAVETGAHIHIDTQPKLARLFARSFPKATVHPTRYMSDLPWPVADKVECRMEMGGLGELFRQTPEDCPKQPYLVADATQSKMWRRAFGKKRPTIGLAWTGGSWTTGREYRSLKLEQLKPMLEEVNANFVSLEYLPDSEEMAGVENLVSYPWATQDSTDYDITASLVAELDLVISVTTTIVDLCGAIGTPCWVLAPKFAPWRYSQSGPEMYWYPHKVYRQDEQYEWAPVLERVHADLIKRFNKGGN